MRMIDPDDLDRRNQRPQQLSQLQVLSIVDAIAAVTLGDVRGRDGVGDAPPTAEQESAALARMLTIRVRNERSLDGARDGQPACCHSRKAGRWRNRSSASGLASASRFFTGWSWMTARTASST